MTVNEFACVATGITKLLLCAPGVLEFYIRCWYTCVTVVVLRSLQIYSLGFRLLCACVKRVKLVPS
jgi:hypothetical protein